MKQAILIKESNPTENIEEKVVDQISVNNTSNTKQQNKQIYDSQEILTKQSEDNNNSKSQTQTSKKLVSSVVSINSSTDYPTSTNTNNNSINNNVSLDLNNVKEKKLKELYKKKIELRTVLQKYQQEFLTKYNRKIKFHKDILPVEKE